MAGYPKNIISMLQMVHIHISPILSKISSLGLKFGATKNERKFFGPNKKVRKMYSLLLYLINKPLISQFLKTICNTNTIDENEPCSKILSNL